MIFDLPMFTLIHVVISVLGLIAGLVAVGRLMAGARMDVWTLLFLAATILTNVTAFGFPSAQLMPSHVVGIISLVVLAVCLLARYWGRMEGRWRTIYVVAAVAALYFNVFVLVAQLFNKIPMLALLAPTQQEPPFAATQGLVLILFVWIGRAALRGFHPVRAAG